MEKKYLIHNIFAQLCAHTCRLLHLVHLVQTKNENYTFSLVSLSIHTVIFNTEPKDTKSTAFMTYILR